MKIWNTALEAIGWGEIKGWLLPGTGEDEVSQSEGNSQHWVCFTMELRDEQCDMMNFTRCLTRTWLGKNCNPWNQCNNLILFVLSAYWSTARSMSGQHSPLQVSMTWKKSCKRVGPANGSAWEEAGEEKMQAAVIQLKATWAGPEMGTWRS